MFIDNASAPLQPAGENTERKILGYTDQMMMVEVHMKAKGTVGPMHSHPHSQCSYCLKGTIEVTVGSEKRVLGKGDVFYALPNQLHGTVALEDDCVLLDVFNPKRDDFLK